MKGLQHRTIRSSSRNRVNSARKFLSRSTSSPPRQSPLILSSSPLSLLTQPLIALLPKKALSPLLCTILTYLPPTATKRGVGFTIFAPLLPPLPLLQDISAAAATRRLNSPGRSWMRKCRAPTILSDNVACCGAGAWRKRGSGSSCSGCGASAADSVSNDWAVGGVSGAHCCLCLPARFLTPHRGISSVHSRSLRAAAAHVWRCSRSSSDVGGSLCYA